MRNKLSGGHQDDYYYTDTEDGYFERKLLLAKVQSDPSKVRHLTNRIPLPKRKMIEAGFILDGPEAKFQPKTASDKRNAFLKLLGLMQKKINETTLGKLPNGKLKIRNFVDFKRITGCTLSMC